MNSHQTISISKGNTWLSAHVQPHCTVGLNTKGYFPPKSPSESHGRASLGSEQPCVPSPPPWLCTALSLLSPSHSHHSHLQLCFLFPFLASSFLLRFLCMDRGLGCLRLLIFPLHHSLPSSPTSSCSIHPQSTRAFPPHSLCYDQHSQSVNHTSLAFLPLPTVNFNHKKEDSWPEKTAKSKVSNTLIKRSQRHCRLESKASKEVEVN